MGSGFIYIVIVGMWLAYFLPRWISNHEEISGRSIERFAHTMRLMGRTVVNAPADISELKKRSERELSNRRIVFTSLSALSILILTLISIGLLSPAIAAIPVSGFALYVVNARHQISALEEEFVRAQNVISEVSKSDRYAEIIKRSRRVTMTFTEFDSEQWTPLSERISNSTKELHGITILPKGSAERANTWEPMSVPVPTYQRATKAAPRRRIDLTKPNVWQPEDEQDLFEALAPTPDQIFDQQLAEEAAEQIRTKRAANE